MSNEITLKAWKNLETPSDHMYLTKDIERGQLPEILDGDIPQVVRRRAWCFEHCPSTTSQ